MWTCKLTNQSDSQAKGLDGLKLCRACTLCLACKLCAHPCPRAAENQLKVWRSVGAVLA